MKRNVVLSTIIGAMATYLPFWRWTDTLAQATGAGAIAIVAFCILLATEKSPRSGNSLRGLENISQGYCKPEKEKKQ